MAKTKRKPRPSPLVEEVPFLYPHEWALADLRLDFMEDRARVALREGYAAARILVAVEPLMPDLDLWKPGEASGILVGTDGKPLALPPG